MLGMFQRREQTTQWGLYYELECKKPHKIRSKEVLLLVCATVRLWKEILYQVLASLIYKDNKYQKREERLEWRKILPETDMT